MNIKKLAPGSNGLHVRRTALAVAIAMGVGLSGQVLAQATTGTITGQAPVASGESVQITGGSGYDRTVPIDSTGHYSVTLPVGTYNVTLLQNGQAVQTRENITPRVSGSVAVNFTGAAGAATAQNLSSVTVTANAIPAIDVSSTNESTIITAEQLKHLPLQRSGAAIALLAPGTVEGAAMIGNGPTGEPLISFGGSSVAENAYYINGFNTSDPLGNAGGITLPYGSIAQQETLTSGYGAQYGRSAGGVISQVGKSGTNDFHFGGQVLWEPDFARGNAANQHYSNPRTTTVGAQKGDLRTYRNGNNSWDTVYDAYVSGPLIKDKLFFFISAEADKSHAATVGSIGAANIDYTKESDPKFYGKLDWNINDSNTLSLTGVQTKTQSEGQTYDYDYDTKKAGAFSSTDQSTKNAFKMWSAKYTSYITDNLTFNALYGKMKGTYYTVQPLFTGLDPSLAHIYSASSQNPLYSGGGGGIQNKNVNGTINNADHKSTQTNLRLDFDWKLGDHDVAFGIDNQKTVDINAGNSMTGPGYGWEYGQGKDGATPLKSGNPYVGPTGVYPGGEDGYYVDKYVFVVGSTVQVKQHAQYIQDNWQVTPNLLLNLGLRNDQFTNYNPTGQAYLRLTSPQWSPRLGASWDVFGDSSLKVFGNAGRYYLAMPAGVALRSAGAPLFTREYFTYTGIDANGIPQNLTPITSNPTGPNAGAANPSGPVPENGENGLPLDPKTVASTNLKAEYQDEFVLGMQQQINPSWVYGVTAEVRKLKREIDDVGDTTTIYNALVAQGADPTTIGTIPGSILINPGSSNTFRVANTAGGYDTAVVSPKDFGFPKATRNYYSLEAYLEHPWDGKWYGKVDYVFSRSYGTTEGPVQSNIGQGGNSVSATEQWDYGQLMSYANGDQANDRKHVLKAYGTYQIAPEWTISGNLTLASGTPQTCLGGYGPEESNPGLGYGIGNYHWCGGVPAPGGSTGFTPWIHTLSLQAEYRPTWANKNLGFSVEVYNVTNEQKATQIYPVYGSTANPSSSYLLPQGYETPRYVRFGVTYDF
ncbi:TonB-dependent receptor [Rhodanobacter sp. Col0626]|uniref:TonB-dependent receptor n=1 Tax=Rhodanobacter sp. Col0626 TaxID=3415679 RepID=UPI003CF49B7A